jgi:hypothetical protein
MGTLWSMYVMSIVSLRAHYRYIPELKLIKISFADLFWHSNVFLRTKFLSVYTWDQGQDK